MEKELQEKAVAMRTAQHEELQKVASAVAGGVDNVVQQLNASKATKAEKQIIADSLATVKIMASQAVTAAMSRLNELTPNRSDI